MADLNRFRSHCTWLRVLSTGVFACLVLILLLPYLVLPVVMGWHDHALGQAFWRNLQLGLVHLLPGLCYLWALWAVRRALGALSRGELFGLAVVGALRQVGYGVVAGAVLSVFAVTNLSRMITHGRGGFAYFDLSGIVLAVVGAALVLMAGLLDRARGMQDELDEIL